MRDVVVSRDVAAPADHVWEVMTDLERAPQVISAIAEVERLDDGDGFGVGTRWRETRDMFGRRATEELEVTVVEPGRSYTVEADGGDGVYCSTTTVAPIDEHSSRLSMTFGYRPGGIVPRVLAATVGRLGEGATRKALRRDLDDIAFAAERTV